MVIEGGRNYQRAVCAFWDLGVAKGGLLATPPPPPTPPPQSPWCLRPTALYQVGLLEYGTEMCCISKKLTNHRVECGTGVGGTRLNVTA